MRHRSEVAMAVVLSLALGGLRAAGAGDPEARPPLIADEAIAAKVDAYIRPYVEGRDFAGAVLIARAGKVILRKAYGMASYELGVPNQPDTKYHVASLTKPFTSTLVLRLEQAGLLRVEDPVSKFVPDFPRGSEITLHHVLSHRAGIPSYNRFPDYDEMMQKRLTLEQTVAWFKDKPLRFEPGARFEYSNSGFTLLAHVIERATGKSYEDVLREQVTGPLGMTGTDNYLEEAVVTGRAAGYEPAEGAAGLMNAKPYDRSAKRGSGSLWSTVDDLYRFDQALYGESLLTAASKAKAFTGHFGGSYGYGWGISRKFGRTEISHDGKAPGYVANLIRYPEEKLSVIFAGNIYSGSMNLFGKDLPTIIFGGQPAGTRPGPLVAVPPATLDEYVGEYEFQNERRLRFRIVRRGESLYIAFLPTARLQYLTPQTPNRFLLRSRYDWVTFERDGSGKVTQVRYAEPAFDAENVCKKLS